MPKTETTKPEETFLEKADRRVLALIKRNYKKIIHYEFGDVNHHTTLAELYKLRSLEQRDVWTALGRLAASKKIKCTGSHRYKSYAPTEDQNV